MRRKPTIGRSFLTIVAIVVGCQTLTGCLYSREMSKSKKIIEAGYPDLDIDRRLTISLGPKLINSAGWIARKVPDEDAFLAGAYLRYVDRVKVALYDVDYHDDFSRANRAAVVDFERNGWTLAVRASDDNEAVWVLYREDSRETVRDLKVVVLSEEELVIARVEGMLNSLLEQLVNDHAMLDDMF